MPKVPVCTHGKWLMSRKLSVIRPTEVSQISTPELIRRYAGSSSAAISGIVPSGSPGHSQTSPYRSSTVSVGKCAAGGTGRPGPDDGTSTQRPPSPNVHPWYGHTRQPLCTIPWLSGASRCGHRSGAATTSPFAVRHTTYGSPSNVTPTGASSTSALSATT